MIRHRSVVGRWAAALAGALAILASAGEPRADPASIVVLRALDKITARVSIVGLRSRPS